MDAKELSVIKWTNQRSKDSKNGSKGKQTFLDDVIRASMKQGSHKIHSKLSNWALEQSSTALQGHPHKDKFPKAPRLTIPEQVFAEEKRRRLPAPGAYDAEKPHTIPNVPKTTSPRLALGGDAEYRSLQTPGHKYDLDPGVNMTKPRT